MTAAFLLATGCSSPSSPKNSAAVTTPPTGTPIGLLSETKFDYTTGSSATSALKLAVTANLVGFLTNNPTTGNGNNVLNLLDFTAPGSPVRTCSYGAAQALPQVKGVFLSGTTAYLATDSGLTILDITNPAAPAVLGTYTEPVGASDIFVSNGIAYIGTTINGVDIVNLANPSAPSLLANYPCLSPYNSAPYSVDQVYVDGTKLFVRFRDNSPPLGTSKSGFLCADLTNLLSPQPTHEYRSSQVSAVFDRSLAKSGNLVYLATDQGTDIIDVTTPSSPVLKASLPAADNLVIRGGYAYLALYSTISVYSLAVPASPSLVETHSLDLTFSSSGMGANGADLFIAGYSAGPPATNNLFVYNLKAPGTTADQPGPGPGIAADGKTTVLPNTTPTPSPAVIVSPTPTASPAPIPSTTPSASPTSTPTPTPGASPTPTPSPTHVPTPTPTPTPATYTVSYDANQATGGQVPASTTNISSGMSISVSGNFGDLVRSGYVFNGWNTSPSGLGTAAIPGYPVTVTSRLVLYAVWVPAGEGSSGSPAALALNTGHSVALSGTITSYYSFTTAEAGDYCIETDVPGYLNMNYQLTSGGPSTNVFLQDGCTIKGLQASTTYFFQLQFSTGGEGQSAADGFLFHVWVRSPTWIAANTHDVGVPVPLDLAAGTPVPVAVGDRYDDAASWIQFTTGAGQDYQVTTVSSSSAGNGLYAYVYTQFPPSDVNSPVTVDCLPTSGSTNITLAPQTTYYLRLLNPYSYGSPPRTVKNFQLTITPVSVPILSMAADGSITTVTIPSQATSLWYAAPVVSGVTYNITILDGSNSATFTGNALVWLYGSGNRSGTAGEHWAGTFPYTVPAGVTTLYFNVEANGVLGSGNYGLEIAPQ